MPKKRKGISSVVGSFFFIVLMVGAFTAILAAFQFQSDLSNTQSQITDTETRKAQENFSLDPDRASGNLVVNVENQGTNSIEIVDIWVVENSVDYEADQISIVSEDAVIPTGHEKNVLENAAAYPIADGSYTIKAVSSLGNIATSQLTLPEVGPEDEGDTIDDKLIAKPSVRVAFPNPLEKQNDRKGYFALIIGNPTNKDMMIYRASIQILAPDNVIVFKGGPGDITGLSPTVTSEWTAGQQYIYWQNMAGVQVPKFSVISLPAEVIVANTGSDAKIATINTNAWTSFGQFGSTKSDTLAALTSGAAVPGMYLANDGTCAGGPKYHVLDLRFGTPQTICVVFKNFSGTNSVATGATLIINVPAEFTIGPVFGGSGFDTTPDIFFFSEDNSQQIRTATDSATIPGGSKTFTFTIQPASDVTTPKLRLLYTYAIGTVSASQPIGPVSEIVVQVCPSGGCPPPG